MNENLFVFRPGAPREGMSSTIGSCLSAPYPVAGRKIIEFEIGGAKTPIPRPLRIVGNSLARKCALDRLKKKCLWALAGLSNRSIAEYLFDIKYTWDVYSTNGYMIQPRNIYASSKWEIS